MAYFSKSEELEETMIEFFTAILQDPTIGAAFAATGALMRVEYTDPDATIWVDCRTADPHVWLGDAAVGSPDIALTMSADDGHRFWLGRLNMTTALATRRVRVSGTVGTLMKLLPVVKHAFPKYREHLEQIGRPDLIV